MSSGSPSRPIPVEHRPAEHLRADAARNATRIVEVAARLLGEDPHVGMAEVANAARVSRATVYRHFPSRDVLMGAIRQQALAHGEQALADCRLEEGSATDALGRLVRTWLDLSERYSFPQLAVQSQVDATQAGLDEQRRIFGEPLIALISRGQAAGEFSAKASARWHARVFAAVVLAGARAVSEGSLTRDEAPDIVVRTLLDGLRP